ncbi:bifunctional RNase H/acid phosphatase [Corynebacterium sp. ES2730-CONJ]|uniref:bifunctional RNase H/acid phosphatase n=1 Tax=Corynebacterium sp. ES2730-CONJ TaxID=2973941 RepID=UPI00216B30CE|nr:bifunctional RNase H/acid phosphatase [Corynebacterium sp. ES2730-CONJ]MCS4532414.1 bifunctional RNase H/acid phosphatase [Corynebacterium sp. ES2730-CONJ]
MKLVIYSDGGSRGNPGVAGAGTVIYDADNNVVQRIAYCVGTATNNVAEYYGLLNGLIAARELGASDLDLRLDSKLIVEQMSGRWKIKHPDMKELALKCRGVMKSFKSVTFTWVPRKDNAAADALANEAMDALAKGAAVGFLASNGDRKPTGDTAAPQPSPSSSQQPDTDTSHLKSSGTSARSTQGERGKDSQPTAPARSKSRDRKPSVIPEAGSQLIFDVDLPPNSPVKPETSAAQAPTISQPAEENQHLNGSDHKEFQGATPRWNGATTQPTRLLLLRHGQTEYSAHKRYSGRSDPPLDGTGAQQAAAAAQYLRNRDDISAIISSPLKRCQETAQAVAAELGLEVTTVDAFVELDFGDFDGLSFTEAHDKDPEFHQSWLGNPEIAAPGGESLSTAYERVMAGLNEVLAEHAGDTVVIVSHVTPIKSIIRAVLGGAPSMVYHLYLDLASLSTVEFYSDGPRCMREFNNTSYLSKN